MGCQFLSQGLEQRVYISRRDTAGRKDCKRNTGRVNISAPQGTLYRPNLEASKSDQEMYFDAAIESLQNSPRLLAREDLKLSQTVQALVLGGGAPQEHSMGPLTLRRAKPAIPFGGSYRLIDIPLSNLLHSGVNKVFVLTQYNSRSLNSHVNHAYPPSYGKNSSHVEVIAASQTCENKQWSRGSADAVRNIMHNLPQLSHEKDLIEDVVIISGEHLYSMDFSALIAEHRQSNADITLSAIAVSRDTPALYGVDGTGLGLLESTPSGHVVRFQEKPHGEDRDTFANVSKGSTSEKPFIASMGIYVFKKDVLHSLLELNPNLLDFGADVIPHALHNNYHLQAYLYDGYWEDISTLRSFYRANLALADANPAFNLEDPEHLTYTKSRCLPPAKIIGACQVEDSILGEGVLIQDSNILHSILSCCTTVRAGCTIKDTLVMGADVLHEYRGKAGEPGSLGIGDNVYIDGAILDKNVSIGSDCRIVNSEGVKEGGSEEQGFLIRSGIVTILKDAVIPNGTII